MRHQTQSVMRSSKESGSGYDTNSSLMASVKPFWKAANRASVFQPLSTARVRKTIAYSATLSENGIRLSSYLESFPDGSPPSQGLTP
ncbi:hypothetical protein UPYG_G00041360 [Umbra pygmaea]|uniref:Uncharacterized protein n=1 Tax=Umbra pygmaea TaxID=75934 RepID=A0ABD0XQ46_UMBPY